ncbi:MAG TPA: hypothetical protein VHO06_12545 [Polyangia bacterium]|nr:hypothetical protein [Polyangia bacterium]
MTTTLRKFDSLTAAEQDAILPPFDAAGAAAVRAGGVAARVADVLRRHVADLAVDEAGRPVLVLEVPVHDVDPRLGDRPHTVSAWRQSTAFIEAMRATKDIGGARSEDAIVLQLMLQTERRQYGLVEGITLLASDATPARVLSDRRAELAAIRKGWNDDIAAAAARDKARAEGDARFQRENAARIAAWNSLPQEARLLHAVAHEHPEHASVLTAVADAIAAHANSRREIMMPTTFRSELARPDVRPPAPVGTTPSVTG